MREPTAGMCVTPNVRLERKFGGGGMGAVWRAEHLALKVPVVVKFLSPALVAETDALGRFAREAAAAAAVRSPHVVQMLDHGVYDGLPFIVMELLDGEDLAHLLQRQGRLPAARVVAIIAQVSKALTRAHERGIIHRDIKPANLFLCEVGHDETFVKVLDFGIAKRKGEISAESVTGSVMGTLFYMSPEQIRDSKNIDHRTDIWALGVVAYEMLTGVRPFGADNLAALSLRIVADPLPVPSQHFAALPRGLDAWFARACARAPAERFQSARELSDALAAALENVPAAPPSATLRAERSSAASTQPEPDALALAATQLSRAAAASATVLPTSTVDGVGVGDSFAAKPATSSTESSTRHWWATGAIVAVAIAVGGVYALTRAVSPHDAAPISPGGEAKATSAAASTGASTAVPPSAPSIAPNAAPSASVSVASSASALPKKALGTKAPPSATITAASTTPHPSSTWKDIQ